MEFALVAAPFLLVLLGIFEISWKTVQQNAIDNLNFEYAQTLARAEDAGVSKADYKANVICRSGNLAVLDCDRILFGAEAYDSDEKLYDKIDHIFVDSWTTGCGGSTVVTEVLYPITHVVLPFAIADVAKYGGKDHYRSRAVIRREPLLAGTGTLQGGGSC